MRGQIGILRRCVICDSLKSMDEFGVLAKACRSCMVNPTGRIQRPRAIVLTDKARALLASERQPV